MHNLHEKAKQAFDTFYEKASRNSNNIEVVNQHQALILQAFYYSDFIQRIATQYSDEFIGLLPNIASFDASKAIEHYCLENVQTALRQNLAESSDETQAYAHIRKCRHLNMMQIAWHDFLNEQSITDSLQVTSHLANILINESYHYLYEQLCKRFGEPEEKQDLLILAMGKLGGNELNFSSDIDLIFTYPYSGETHHPRKPIEHQVFFTRLAQRFIKMLDHVTQDGRVFRVDMRLRPLGESGPLVLPFSAFESYYLEQGREWERFAMQKMRIVNNTPFNDELKSIITPFVYRKYIDFTTLESIREMKRLIENEVRRRQITNNIKLGKGGIREVEFFIQSIQLIHAGRDDACQTPSILRAMKALVNAGFLDAKEQEALQADYLYLRKAEHYIQAFNDEQTQTLPESEHNQERLNALIQGDEQSDYQLLISNCMARINKVFSSLVDDANETKQKNNNDPINDTFDDLWHVEMPEEEFIDTCSAFFDARGAKVLFHHLGLFKKKVDRSGVSARGVKSINKLMPLLLHEFGVEKNSLADDEIEGLFGILQTIIGRITYIDLLLEHPDVRHRLRLLCKKSPWISQQIAQYPLLLDELLHPIYLNEDTLSLQEWKLACADQLRQSMLRVDLEDPEMVMDKLREFKHTNQLRIAAADIMGVLAINQVSDKLTILAEVLMQQVIEYAYTQMIELYGIPSGGDLECKNIALIAYGKFGGIELSYDSDLDLVFLHNTDLSGSTDESGSRKQLSNQEFYIKLVQRISHISGTKTYNGILYEIDLRLRPSGNSGLLISHVDSFAEYQQEKAWTWEHQALVRSRVVYASQSLRNNVYTIREQVIAKHRVKSELCLSVYEMRRKMRDHLLKEPNAEMDLKHTHGGIVDIEFMVQYWVLLSGEQHAKQLHWSDNLRLLETLCEINVISKEMQQGLSKAYLSLRHASHRLQLAKLKYARVNSELLNATQYVAECFDELFSAS
ncbi:bifunctional [glutamate--ammonia ligase]-adenylyl-L-tyrosine phosphorylase/[glutamate--ammonia-ligase] adenylyltransferase [Glaciecola sp. 2405UD65-10]|uniref:bifunctional [glutamate--ammonia ligase]-adenylyl-L-tyrosine phosphorylase/[glutamate--ammonia-ligase] adenylyltransferase n=1 Tax=Glaciecola sp. 2405UD65-10 TaxID=3397244 RepID=UPI003B5AE2AE